MTQLRISALALLALGLASLSAQAQDAPAALKTVGATPESGIQPAEPRAASPNAVLYSSAPVVRLFGVPEQLQISAPVDPSYAPTAYRTFAGQAETSADAVAEQNVTWR